MLLGAIQMGIQSTRHLLHKILIIAWNTIHWRNQRRLRNIQVNTFNGCLELSALIHIWLFSELNCFFKQCGAFNSHQFAVSYMSYHHHSVQILQASRIRCMSAQIPGGVCRAQDPKFLAFCAGNIGEKKSKSPNSPIMLRDATLQCLNMNMCW